MTTRFGNGIHVFKNSMNQYIAFEKAGNNQFLYTLYHYQSPGWALKTLKNRKNVMSVNRQTMNNVLATHVLRPANSNYNRMNNKTLVNMVIQLNDPLAANILARRSFERGGPVTTGNKLHQKIRSGQMTINYNTVNAARNLLSLRNNKTPINLSQLLRRETSKRTTRRR